MSKANRIPVSHIISRRALLSASFLALGLIALLQSCSSNKLLYPVEIQSLYGFIDHWGELRVAPKYPSVQRYTESFATVQRLDGSLAYLNLDGEELEVPDEYGPIEKLDVFSDGMARVVVGQRVGYIDKKLNWTIVPQYRQAGRFSEGMAAVLNTSLERAAFINKKGDEVFALEDVSAIGPMRAGFAYFVRDGRFGIVSKQGEIAKQPDFLFLASADPHSGLARALDDKTELYGFVDRNGSWVIPPRYPNAGDFSEGFATVYIRNENRYGYIDSRGNLRIPARFLAAGDFHDGFAWVYIDKGYRYIDRDGQWLSPLIFTKTQDFYEGLAAAVQDGNHLYLDKEGSVTWSNQ